MLWFGDGDLTGSGMGEKPLNGGIGEPGSVIDGIYHCHHYS
jgi:hypothetical protein